MTFCLICGSEIAADAGNTPPVFDCPRCGPWQFVRPKGGHAVPLDVQLKAGPSEQIRRANLSRKVRQMGEQSGIVNLPLDQLENWSLDNPLPSPIDQLNNLILRVGDGLPSAAHILSIEDMSLAAWLGTAVSDFDQTIGLKWLLNQSELEQCILAQPTGSGSRNYSLKWDGWVRYNELKRQEVTSNIAFMAMQFGDTELDSVVRNWFAPAVEATGFVLQRLNDGQGAGSIDDQLRVALRTSRLAVVDLTHHNRGAYWEAGYAEGLGKPVIYTCKKSVWDTEPVHFDTNHLVTIIWDPSDLADAATRLKATIRATLPEIAILSDG